MISVNVVVANGPDLRRSYGSEDSMTGASPTATPGPLFVKDSPYPEDRARTLAERRFYVFGSLLNSPQRSRKYVAPTAQDVSEGG